MGHANAYSISKSKFDRLILNPVTGILVLVLYPATLSVSSPNVCIVTVSVHANRP